MTRHAGVGPDLDSGAPDRRHGDRGVRKPALVVVSTFLGRVS
jgi:hypothetical protein